MTDPGQFMDNLSAEAARQDAEKAEEEATPEEAMATLQVQAQLDRLVEKGSQLGKLVQGDTSDLVRLNDGKYEVSIMKYHEGHPLYADFSLTELDNAPGDTFLVSHKQVRNGREKLAPSQSQSVAEKLSKLFV